MAARGITGDEVEVIQSLPANASHATVAATIVAVWRKNKRATDAELERLIAMMLAEQRNLAIDNVRRLFLDSVQMYQAGRQ